MQTITDVAIETVAKAIYAEREGPFDDWLAISGTVREHFRRMARAAMTAMREMES